VPVQLDCVRGEYVSFQFVVSAGDAPIESLAVAPTPLATFDAQFIRPEGLAFFRENFVRVAHPSGNRIQTPKWWPDALIPFSLASQRIEAKGSAVFWATLRVPDDAAPGDYFGELDITANGQPRRLALTFHVRPISLPKSNFRGTVALYYDTLRDWYSKNGNNFSDEEWDAQKRRFAGMLLDFGLNPYDPPSAWNDASVDDYLKNPRVHSVRIPPLDSPGFSLAVEALRRTDTVAKFFYYWNDEPQTKEQFDAIKANSQKLRALHIPQLVTHHPTPELLDSVDIWCPNITDAMGSGHLDIPELKREQLKGHPTWLYTMVVPKHPFPTWLLDDDSTAILSFAPLWSKVGATGFVYSMAHGWGPKPLDNLESFQQTNGDGTLLYPSELVGGVGPMPSIRLMLLRDAIEDLALWNEATKRNIAPNFSFPVTRSGALVYNRTPLLNALESGKRAAVKPLKAPQLFSQKPTSTTFGLPFARALGARRSVEITLRNGDVRVRLVGPKLQQDEELVVLLAPLEIQKQTNVSRYSLDSTKEITLSVRTDSSQPAAPLSNRASVSTDGTEMVFALPPSLSRVRFNVLLRSPQGTMRLFPDGNDPFSMPILQFTAPKPR